VYILNNVDYKNGIIQMSFTNTFTGDKAEINIDINDEHPEVFIICWDDIKEMVYNESANNVTDDELLEFDFE
jgi:hypothetical protein